MFLTFSENRFCVVARGSTPHTQLNDDAPLRLRAADGARLDRIDARRRDPARDAQEARLPRYDHAGRRRAPRGALDVRR